MNVNERLARAVGWTFCTAVECGKWVHPRTGRHAPVPDYEHSMDALVRDVVPVLRGRGWHVSIETVPNVHSPWHADVFTRTDREGAAVKNVSCAVAATPAAALSEAAALALEATNG